MRITELFTTFAIVMAILCCIYVAADLFCNQGSNSRIISITDGPEMRKITKIALEAK